MIEKEEKIIEEFPDERLIVEELHKDEKKIKIAFLAIAALFAVVVSGIFYLVTQEVKNQNTLNIVNQLANDQSSVPISISTEASQVASESSPTPIVIVKKVAEGNSIKEQFISFGTGSNQTSEWEDVPGLQASIDFGNYQNIKDIRFEVSVSIPTANQTASVRLFNVTDKHPVWNSEITTANNVYAVSSPIIYDNGSKTYQVQMKTQLKYLANLTQARLHIVLQ
jgi:hypothetical protein